MSAPTSATVGAGGSSDHHAAAGERALMARSLSALFLAAGLLGPVTVVTPHYPGIDVVGVLVLSVTALLVAGGLWLGRHRVTVAVLHGLVATGALMVGVCIHLTMGVPNAGSLFFVWLSLYAFYFFPRRAALAHMALVATVYALDIALRPPPFPPVAHWLTLVVTLLVAGALVGVLKGRLDATIARLGEAARTDDLTGLLNRRGFNDLLTVEVERSRRTGRPVCLITGDLDHFKLVNDRFGHAAGDEVLRRFAALLEEGRRRIDTTGRLGGEEFAILLPDSGEEAGLALAQRLREAVRRTFAGDRTALTISFGVASLPRHGETVEALLKAADDALYTAKERGRDRVEVHGLRTAVGVPAQAGRRSHDGGLAAILALASTMDLRDASTASHARTVGYYAELIACELGLDAGRIERVRLAGLVHDLGKIGLPDAILRKPGPLDAAEWAQIRRHPELGARLLEGAGLDDLAAWVRAHHERPDGRGYPYGLAGEDVPLESRILAVADAYEAMTADRVYRPAMAHADARRELVRQAATQFDEGVVTAFCTALDAAERELVAA